MDRLAPALVLLLALFPLIRLLTTRGFRRRLSALSYITVLLALCLLGYVALIIFFVLVFPPGLYLFLALVALVYTIHVWYARPTNGASQHHPPGSLSLIPYGQWADPLYYQNGFKKYGPIYKSSDLYRPSVNMLGIARARAFLDQHANTLTVPPFVFNRFIPNGFLRFASSKEHAFARPIFQSSFNPAITRELESALTETIRAELRDIASLSQSNAAGIHAEESLQQLTLLCLSRVFFGLVPGTTAFTRWLELLHVIAFRRASRVTEAQVGQALAGIMTLLQIQAASESTTRSYLSELNRVHPQALTDPFFIYNLIYMFQIGRSDLTGLLHWILKLLSDNPAWADRLRAQNAPADLPVRTVLETLRLQQSEFILRRTTREIRFQNFVIPSGWFVRLCIKESHHASTLYENAETFDPDRFLARRFTRDEYLPFGAYDKSCLGENLTLTIARLFTRELTRSYTWRVLSDGPPEFSGFHWQPGSNFRIALNPSSII